MHRKKDAAPPSSQIPLQQACAAGDLLTVFEFIGRHSTQTECAADDIYPLHEACKHDHHDIAEALLKAAWHPDAGEGVSEKTPLMYASEQGEANLVETLLLYGACPDAQDANGWTALHYAAFNATGDVDFDAYHHALRLLIM